MERIFQEQPVRALLVASDGSAARRLANDAPPSLTLADLNLPDISGEDLIRVLRIDLAVGVPSIVALSTGATSETIERLDALGVVAYLTNPYDINRLLEVVDSTCRLTAIGS